MARSIYIYKKNYVNIINEIKVKENGVIIMIDLNWILSSAYSAIKNSIFIVKLRSQNVLVGKYTFIHWNSHIEQGTTIGDYTRINGPIRIKGHGKVIIGKYCACGYNTSIITSNHIMTKANIQMKFQENYSFSSIVEKKGPTLIGNNVWIGDNVTILPGITIASGAVIGAGSVVTKDVPPFSVVVGVPAVIIKKRFNEEIIKKMLEIKWWNWDIKKIKRNRNFFNADLTKLSVDEIDTIIE